MKNVVNGVPLLMALLLGHQVLGQQAPTENLPEAPEPALSTPQSPVQPDGSVGQKQRSNSRPGFPPVSQSEPGLMPVAPAARLFESRSQCLPDACTVAQRFMCCRSTVPIFSRFLNSATPLPLTAKQKFILAVRNVSDPSNLATIGGLSAITIAADSHTADGPGFRGFGKNAAVSLTQDMTGEFFSTFLIPSLVHQDPHYHRMPNLSLGHRIAHVLDAVVIAQSDEGVPMFNYATVVGTICTNSLGNVYVPGRKHSFGASASRISISLATDPIGNAITEFVPDLARHVNIQVVLVQRIINRVAIAEGGAAQE
ncbi:MAG: hypothetical protein WA510_21865 [Acidobacteriaceae bacterium]